MENERLSIRDTSKILRKYGSTNQHNRTTEHLVKHELERSDTLQGIALKYGCSTEQIRRANRLFTQDSLFLRQHLLIPVQKGSPFYPDDLTGTVLLTGTTTSQPKELASGSRGETTVVNQEEDSKKDMEELLNKIDSTIAKTKKLVENSSNSFRFDSFDDSDGTLSTSSSSYYYQNPRSPGNGSNMLDGSSGTNLNNNRRVHNSLQRLAKQQDELFEL